jgi:hypothetical protein
LTWLILRERLRAREQQIQDLRSSMQAKDEQLARLQAEATELKMQAAGLGTRIAYLFIRSFGKKTLGLAYSIAASDLVLSPATPSNTARAGGVIYYRSVALQHLWVRSGSDGEEDRGPAAATSPVLRI